MDPVSNNIGESIYRQQCQICGASRPIHSPEVGYEDSVEDNSIAEFPSEWLTGFIQGDRVANKERIALSILGFAGGVLVMSVIFLLTIYLS